MGIKKQLAHQIVRELHSQKDANDAQKKFETIFQKRDITSSDIPVFNTSHTEWNLVDFLFEAGLAGSKSEAKRLIEQKAVEQNTSLLTSHVSRITVANGDIIKVGKKKFLRIQIVV